MVDVQVRDENVLDVGGHRAALGEGVNYVERNAGRGLASGGLFDNGGGQGLLGLKRLVEVDTKVLLDAERL